jgi:hypothetical protein
MRRGEVQVKLNKTHTSQGYVTGTPKTARAVRAVPILDEGLFRDLGLHLRNHPHRDDLEAGLWPGKVAGHNRLSYDREFDPKGFYRYTFKPACVRAGLAGLHFHELRHTFATLALESGALDMHELSRAMGHASYAITDKVYAHLRPRDYSRHRWPRSRPTSPRPAVASRPLLRWEASPPLFFGRHGELDGAFGLVQHELEALVVRDGLTHSRRERLCVLDTPGLRRRRGLKGRRLVQCLGERRRNPLLAQSVRASTDVPCESHQPSDSDGRASCDGH